MWMNTATTWSPFMMGVASSSGREKDIMRPASLESSAVSVTDLTSDSSDPNSNDFHQPEIHPDLGAESNNENSREDFTLDHGDSYDGSNFGASDGEFVLGMRRESFSLY